MKCEITKIPIIDIKLCNQGLDDRKTYLSLWEIYFSHSII
jgi:hypothetical protein